MDDWRPKTRERERLFGGLGQDTRFAFRTLLRNPLFTLAALVSLAFGIGANTAIYTFVHGYLIAPLPFRESDRLVSVLTVAPSRGRDRWQLSYPEVLELREASRAFSELGAYARLDVTLTGGDEPRRLFANRISYDLFELLGAAPALGRSFAASDGQENAPPVAILHHSLWQTAFGSDPEVVGRTIYLDGAAYTVVGVMPPSFDFPPVTHLWIPIRPSPSETRQYRTFRLVGILEDEVSPAEAQTEMDLFSARWQEEYPDSNEGVQIYLETLRTDLLDDNGTLMEILYAIVSLVLLLACANVANLLLTRGTSRRHEIAIRASLGAGRGRIVRQLLTESLLLALAGGALGLVLGRWGRDLFMAVRQTPPTYFTFDIDLAVVAVLTGITLLCGLLCGLMPALVATRPGLEQVLRGGDVRTSGRGRFQTLLVGAELAVAVMVLVAAGLMIKSFLTIESTDMGINPDNVLTMEINLGSVGYEERAGRIRFFQDLVETIRSHPEVVDAAASNPLPAYGWPVRYELVGTAAAGDAAQQRAIDAVITPGYFRTLEIPLLRGRDFDERDTLEAPPVVIVSETFARLNWPGEEAVGQRIRVLDAPWTDDTVMEVVGVVGDTHVKTFATPRGWFFRPQSQVGADELILVIRTRSDPLPLIDHVKQLVWAVEPNLAVHWNDTLANEIETRFWQPPTFSRMFSLFALFALLMACVGVYGVTAYSVVRRSREFGIRLSIGARPADVVRQVLREGGTLTLSGIVVGLAGAFLLMRLAASLFYGVSPTDPLIYALSTVVMVLVALGSCWLPARSASRVDPVRALRTE